SRFPVLRQTDTWSIRRYGFHPADGGSAHPAPATGGSLPDRSAVARPVAPARTRAGPTKGCAAGRPARQRGLRGRLADDGVARSAGVAAARPPNPVAAAAAADPMRGAALPTAPDWRRGRRAFAPVSAAAPRARPRFAASPACARSPAIRHPVRLVAALALGVAV